MHLPASSFYSLILCVIFAGLFLAQYVDFSFTPAWGVKNCKVTVKKLEKLTGILIDLWRCERKKLENGSLHHVWTFAKILCSSVFNQAEFNLHTSKES
jgi:hypothetical protein